MESIVRASELYQRGDVELIYKSKVKASNRSHIKPSTEAYEALLKLGDENKSLFK